MSLSDWPSRNERVFAVALGEQVRSCRSWDQVGLQYQSLNKQAATDGPLLTRLSR